MSIATAQFSFPGTEHLISRVKTIAETRRARLQMLLDKHGTLAAINDLIELPRTDATLSQIKNQSPHHKTGKPRSMGDDMARRIEEKLDLETGWMDTPPSYSELHGEADPISKAIDLMAAMEPEARYQAVRLLDALAQPTKANGTTGH
jgi:hypothetical protein